MVPADAGEGQERPPRICLTQGLKRETKSRAKRPRDGPSRPSSYWNLFRPLTSAEMGQAETADAAASSQSFDEGIELNFDTDDGHIVEEGAVEEAQEGGQQDEDEAVDPEEDFFFFFSCCSRNWGWRWRPP